MEDTTSPLFGKYLITGMQNGVVEYPMFMNGMGDGGRTRIKIVGAETADGALNVYEDQLPSDVYDNPADTYATLALGNDSLTAKAYSMGYASDYADDAALIAAVQSLFE